MFNPLFVPKTGTQIMVVRAVVGKVARRKAAVRPLPPESCVDPGVTRNLSDPAARPILHGLEANPIFKGLVLVVMVVAGTVYNDREARPVFKDMVARPIFYDPAARPIFKYDPAARLISNDQEARNTSAAVTTTKCNIDPVAATLIYMLVAVYLMLPPLVVERAVAPRAVSSEAIYHPCVGLLPRASFILVAITMTM